MTALLVIFSIILLVGIDAIKLLVQRSKESKDIIYEPGLGPCMADGLRKED